MLFCKVLVWWGLLLLWCLLVEIFDILLKQREKGEDISVIKPCTCIDSINSQDKAEWKEEIDHTAWWVCLTPEAMALTMALATSYSYSSLEPAEDKMRSLL